MRAVRSVRTSLRPSRATSRIDHTSAVRQLKAQLDAQGKRFAIIVSRWNEAITGALLDGALDEFARHGDPDVGVIHVPGAWEIPVVAAKLCHGAADTRPHGIVALGCVLQGATNHAALLSADVGASLQRLQTETHVPIAWGILTPENQEQALERSGMKLGNKGREAALSAIEMASILERL